LAHFITGGFSLILYNTAVKNMYYKKHLRLHKHYKANNMIVWSEDKFRNNCWRFVLL